MLDTPTMMPAGLDLDRLADDLKRDGACILRGLFDRAKMEEWARAFDALFHDCMNRPGGLAPREQARYYLTLPWRPPFLDPDVFAHPALLGVLERALGPDFVMVQMGADIPVKGSDYQETHRDHPPLFGDDVVTPLYALAVNFPLVDVTPENGPLEMARGTHVLPREKGLARIASGEIPLEPLPMAIGDVMIRTPLALHRGTPNQTDTPRPMVVMGYVRAWLSTPHLDMTIRRADHEALPERARTLLRCDVVDELPQDKAETYINFKY